MTDDTPEFPGSIEDEPSPAPRSTAAAPQQPTWTYFLSPAALVLGSIIISLTIWYTSDDSGGGALKGTAVAAVNESVKPDDVAPVSSAKTLTATFAGYAKQVGGDEAKFSQCLQNQDTAQTKIALINGQLQRGAALGINGTPTFVINNKMIVGAQPGVIFDEIIERELKGSPTSLEGYSANIQALASSSPPRFQILPAKVDVSDAPVEGNRNARVMIAEFSDFQCPFCKRWNDENLARIRTKIGNDVALAFLHFPITQIHPNAGNASIAAICANEQGKFWQMHDLLFARQTEWENLPIK
ncbi:MAG: thioredoxin domain-containing protein [Anaerolineaceae bacterium]